MTLPSTNILPGPADGPLITKAFLKASAILGLKQKEMADVLGKSEPTISRLTRHTLVLSATGKEGEISLLFLRMYRSLDALFGGHEENIRQWFSSLNHDLGGIPRELIKTLQGLLNVIHYLDAMRGKV